jgi:hypothetical protein
MDLPLSRTPWSDHGIMTVWGKSRQAASFKSARRRRARRLAETLTIEWFDQEIIQARRKHGLAVIGLCVGFERKHVGSRIADERFRHTDSPCRFQAVHFRHPHIHENQVVRGACRTRGQPGFESGCSVACNRWPMSEPGEQRGEALGLRGDARVRSALMSLSSATRMESPLLPVAGEASAASATR